MTPPPSPLHAASRRRKQPPSSPFILLLVLFATITINVAAATPTRLRSRDSRELGAPPMYELAPAPPADREQMVEGSGVALGTTTSTTGEKYVVQTGCGFIRSGYFVQVGQRDMDEHEIEGQNTTVVPFYGIRYAAPLATNASRWTVPQPAPCPMEQAGSTNSSSGWVYDAGDWKEGCVQPDGKSGVEDCLYLNIFTPLSTLRSREPPCPLPLFPPSSSSSSSILGGVACNNSSSSGISSISTERKRGQKQAIPSSAAAGLLPVVVYLHGGGLMEGSSKSSPLAGVVGDNRFGPVVAVSLNYRLNIFGFLALEDLSHEQGGVSGNYGLQDQQEALRWIQKNIQHFGGDPKRITLIGHSSGGTSIFALLSSPASVGLFHGAISLSGSPNITMSLPQAHVQNQPILDATPCAALQTPALRLDCLRGLPASTLLGLMLPSWSTPGIFDLPKGPEGQEYGGLPAVDGKTLTHSFLDGLEAGIVDVPLIISSMGNEVDCCTMRDVRNFMTTQWEDLLVTHFTPWGGEQIGRTIASFYTEEAAVSPQKALTALISDIGVMCGSNEAASRAATGGKRKSPIYLLVDKWAPSAPLPRGTESPPSAYALHGWDNINWMRDYPSLPPSLPSSSDLAHSRFLREMVWSFANGKGGGWAPPGEGREGGKEVGVYVLEPPMVEGGREGGMVMGYKKEACAYFREVGLWETNWWAN